MKVFVNEMFIPLVSENNKKAMNKTVKQLNASVEKDSCFDFEDDEGYDWNFHECCVCDMVWYVERPTCNGTTSEAVKLHSGLRCPHCGCGYCSFEHMKPQILVPNTDDINELTGIKSCVIYKMCAAYLKHMTMSNSDDSFFTVDNGYDITSINDSISKSINDIELENLRYVLMNRDVEYDEDYLKEDVVRFIDEHYNDCEKYKQRIDEYNEYMDTDAKIIISTFVGCGKCLK